MGDPDSFARYIDCVAQCETIAVEIFPAYSTRYANVRDMMHVPPALAELSFAHQLQFMQSKLQLFEKMRSDLRSPSESASAAEAAALQQPRRPDVDGASAAGGATQDLSCTEPFVKKLKASRSMRIKRDTLEWVRTLTKKERLEAIAGHMNDIDALPLTLAKSNSARLT